MDDPELYDDEFMTHLWKTDKKMYYAIKDEKNKEFEKYYFDPSKKKKEYLRHPRIKRFKEMELYRKIWLNFVLICILISIGSIILFVYYELQYLGLLISMLFPISLIFLIYPLYAVKRGIILSLDKDGGKSMVRREDDPVDFWVNIFFSLFFAFMMSIPISMLLSVLI